MAERLDRRDFLRMLAPLLPATLAACGWDGGPRAQPIFDRVIAGNNALGQQLQRWRGATAPAHQVVKGTMPSYFISDEMPELTDPDAWQLEVGGLVRTPTNFTPAMLGALPHIAYSVEHHCVEGWSAVAGWRGVPFSIIADLVQPTPAARYVKFESFDNGYMNGWDLESAMHPQTILADGFGDQPITAAHGAPLRLYSPIKLGYKLTKYLTRVTFTAEKPGGYWEDQGYPWFGGL